MAKFAKCCQKIAKIWQNLAKINYKFGQKWPTWGSKRSEARKWQKILVENGVIFENRTQSGVRFSFFRNVSKYVTKHTLWKKYTELWHWHLIIVSKTCCISIDDKADEFCKESDKKINQFTLQSSPVMLSRVALGRFKSGGSILTNRSSRRI